MWASYSRFHWRTFNVLARVFGLMAAMVATSFVGWGAYFAVRPAAAINIETAGLPASLLYLAVGFALAGIAAAVLRVQPYRPDLGDGAWTFTKSRVPAGQRRSWWTGEPNIRQEL